LGEEYLADHFPAFPVMPGVLMLQTLVESGAWLLRLTDDFQYSLIVLSEVRNVKFGNFMEPGRVLLVTVELLERQGARATLKGKAEVDGQSTVSARLTLACGNLREDSPALRTVDERIVTELREQSVWLRGQTSARKVTKED
jgi:3-hydroxyacyl-[acyl-carrier-protein] dehydratase